MGTCEKLREKARNSQNNFRFSDICKLAECYGWNFRRQDGTSHRQYSNPRTTPEFRYMNFQNAGGGKAVPYQVRQLLKAIESLEDE